MLPELTDTPAELEEVADDIFRILNAAPDEVAALRAALVAGKIDGGVYAGDCCCLIGTIAKLRGLPHDDMPEPKARPESAAEIFITRIGVGDTPQNSAAAAYVVAVIDSWVALRSEVPA